MSAKIEKKFRKMHKKQIGNIAGTDFKIYHKKVDDMIFKKNLIITLLLIGIGVLIVSNVFLIVEVLKYG